MCYHTISKQCIRRFGSRLHVLATLGPAASLQPLRRCSPVGVVCCVVLWFSKDQVRVMADISNAELKDVLRQPRPEWSRVRWVNVQVGAGLAPIPPADTAS